MSEAFPEVPNVSVSGLSEMAQLWTLDTQPTLQDPTELYDQAFSAYRSATCKGNPEEIIEAEERLRSLRETYPEVLNER